MLYAAVAAAVGIVMTAIVVATAAVIAATAHGILVIISVVLVPFMTVIVVGTADEIAAVIAVAPALEVLIAAAVVNAFPCLGTSLPSA